MTLPPEIPVQPPPERRAEPTIARCTRCGGRIDAGDAYCRHCGKKHDDAAAWYYHPVWILVLALLVIGPFALPLVWLSPRMGLGAKLALTVVIGVYTVVTLYLCYELFILIYRHVSEFQDLQHLL